MRKKKKTAATTKIVRNVTICTIYEDCVQKIYNERKSEKGHACTCLNTRLCGEKMYTQKADNKQKNMYRIKHTHSFTAA